MEFGLGRKVEDEAALGHELRSGLGMMVYSRSGVERQPVGCVLTDVEVAGQVVFRAVGQVGFKARSDNAVPGVSAEVLPVGAQGDGVAFKETIALINRHACLEVVVQIKLLLGGCCDRMTVVDVMVAPAHVAPQGSVGAVVVIGEAYTGYAAKDATVVVDEGG